MTQGASQCAAKRRVLVVGGGAAGTAAAWSLSRSPAFHVSLWESAPVLGGVATTESLTLADGSIVAINDGVQGGAPSYRNCLSMHAALGGFVPQQVFMKVAFGKGGLTWSNVGAPSELVRRLQPDIARFGRVLRRVDALPVIFAFVPIRRVLRLWRFDPDFGERLVYPLTALFFGTGNRTPEVSAAIIARVFLDPKLRLFDYSPERLLDSSPEMFAFQQLGDIYATAADKLRTAGVDVRLSCACSRVQRFPGTAHAVVATDAAGAAHNFDAVVFACDAATALKLLERPGYWERHVLGSVRYYDDVTYTHSDEAYMHEHYELHADAPDERPGESLVMDISLLLIGSYARAIHAAYRRLLHLEPSWRCEQAGDELRPRPLPAAPAQPPAWRPAHLPGASHALSATRVQRHLSVATLHVLALRRASSWTAPAARRPGQWTASPKTRSCWSSGGASSATRRRTSAPSCRSCALRRAARAAPPSTRAPGRW